VPEAVRQQKVCKKAKGKEEKGRGKRETKQEEKRRERPQGQGEGRKRERERERKKEKDWDTRSSGSIFFGGRSSRVSPQPQVHEVDEHGHVGPFVSGCPSEAYRPGDHDVVWL
jgi:hypothetical protein